MKWPRIDFMIAAVSPHNSGIAASFKKEQALLARWVDEYFGWPRHQFQRAYLKSLMLGIPPTPGHESQLDIAKLPHPGVTAEPQFSPQPSVSTGNFSITLRCATPGAIIHYSLGGSQPLENAAIYRAPIVMKGLPMTIKAFASAPGMKDSPVVTGNFRINE